MNAWGAVIGSPVTLATWATWATLVTWSDRAAHFGGLFVGENEGNGGFSWTDRDFIFNKKIHGNSGALRAPDLFAFCLYFVSITNKRV